MARIVKKFGGTSLGDLTRLEKVAGRIKASYDAGDELAIVVSAMEGITAGLIEKCSQVYPMFDAREYDVVVSSGEQVSVGLMVMALQAIGVPARSWLGWQLPIKTDGVHGNAHIISIDTGELEARISAREVPVVAGFQGLGPDARITTIGPGGSDLTAVMLAHELGAERCDIYTDVPGIYTADPRLVPKARRLEEITYEEMLSFASVGAKVLSRRSVKLAMQKKVIVQVLSSFENLKGTYVTDRDNMTRRRTSGIALSANEAKVTLIGIKDEPGTVAAIFAPLTADKIEVGMIVQDVTRDGKSTNVTFTVENSHLDRALELISNAKKRIGYDSVSSDKNVVKISVVGLDLEGHTNMAQILFDALGSEGINIQAISTSEIKISVLVAAEFAELAVRRLHSAYGLDQK
jgi:aspartate kinase